jgi:hypothetical protein
MNADPPAPRALDALDEDGARERTPERVEPTVVVLDGDHPVEGADLPDLQQSTRSEPPLPEVGEDLRVLVAHPRDPYAIPGRRLVQETALLRRQGAVRAGDGIPVRVPAQDAPDSPPDPR